MSLEQSQDPQEKSEERGRGFAQILHDRSRESGEALHKLLISLSTAVFAVYFIAVTNTAVQLTHWQVISAIAGLVFTALAILCGILCWYSDGRRNYYWASALQAEDKKDRDTFYHSRDKWLKWDRIFMRGLFGSFIAGILISTAWVVLRILQQ